MQSVMLSADSAIFLLLLDSKEQELPIDMVVNQSPDHGTSNSSDEVDLLSDVDDRVTAESCDNENMETIDQPPQPEQLTQSEPESQQPGPSKPATPISHSNLGRANRRGGNHGIAIDFGTPR